MWPGPSIITWQPCSQAFSVSSPSVFSSANWASSLASARQPGRRPSPRRVGHVVRPHDLAQFVEVRVPRVLLVVGDHPLRHQRPAAADDAGHAVARQRDVLEQHAGVDGHVVDALLRLMLDHVEHLLRRQVGRVLDLLDRLVDRHRADRHRRGVDDRLADAVDVAAGATGP